MISQGDMEKAREIVAEHAKSPLGEPLLFQRIALALSTARKEENEEAAKIAEGFTYEQGSTRWIHGSDIAKAIRLRAGEK